MGSKLTLHGLVTFTKKIILKSIILKGSTGKPIFSFRGSYFSVPLNQLKSIARESLILGIWVNRPVCANVAQKYWFI